MADNGEYGWFLLQEMREFLKFYLYRGLGECLFRKICELFWQFGPRKLKLMGRLVAPQNNKQSAPAYLDEFASRRICPIQRSCIATSNVRVGLP